MEGSWEGFLDIIGLNQDIRQKADLKALIEFPLAEPKTDLLINLFDYITSIYGSERCTILWWYEPSCINGKNISNPYTKIISVNVNPKVDHVAHVKVDHPLVTSNMFL